MREKERTNGSGFFLFFFSSLSSRVTRKPGEGVYPSLVRDGSCAGGRHGALGAGQRHEGGGRRQGAPHRTLRQGIKRLLIEGIGLFRRVVVVVCVWGGEEIALLPPSPRWRMGVVVLHPGGGVWDGRPPPWCPPSRLRSPSRPGFFHPVCPIEAGRFCSELPARRACKKLGALPRKGGAEKGPAALLPPSGSGLPSYPIERGSGGLR